MAQAAALLHIIIKTFGSEKDQLYSFASHNRKQTYFFFLLLLPVPLLLQLNFQLLDSLISSSVSVTVSEILLACWGQSLFPRLFTTLGFYPFLLFSAEGTLLLSSLSLASVLFLMLVLFNIFLFHLL